jgi:ribosomal protein L3 glutamine methyltransferase
VAFGHGTTNAVDEAAWLVTAALSIPFEELAAATGRTLTGAERRRIDTLVARRIDTRTPTAYLTGEAWLGEYRFRVDPRVIVPRSFIAELLLDRMRPWITHPHRVRRILDLCTGSGCLAIIAASGFPKARVDAVDLSGPALAVARRNVRDYRLTDRIRLEKGDLFEPLGADARYDLILANPPYVDANAMAKLPPEYLREPALSLAGGRDGLDLVRRIVRGASARLAPEGLLVVEIGHRRALAERVFPALSMTWPVVSGGDDCVFVVPARDLPSVFSGAPERRSPPSPGSGEPPRARVRGARRG